MSIDSIKESRVLTKLLQFLAVWPIKTNPKKWYTKLIPYFWFILHIPTSITFTLLLYIRAIVSSDLNSAIGVLYLAFTHTDHVIKTVNMRKYARLAKALLDDWSSNTDYCPKTNEEIFFWELGQKRFSAMSYSYIFGTMFSVSLIFLGKAGSEYKLPVDIWSPFSLETKSVYWIMFNYALITTVITALSNCILDMFYCYVMHHLGLLYKMLGQRLECLGSEGSGEEFHKDLIDSIKICQRLKSFAESSENIVSKPMFAQIVLSSLIICVSIYRLQNLQIHDDFGNFIATAEYSMVVTIQIFLPCYFGNQILQNSDELANKIYCSHWISMPEDTKKILYSFMISAKYPVAMRASAFFKIDLSTFAKVMNNAYTLLALLANMKE